MNICIGYLAYMTYLIPISTVSDETNTAITGTTWEVLGVSCARIELYMLAESMSHDIEEIVARHFAEWG